MNYVDPTGLYIQLIGTTGEKNQLLLELQTLTNYELYYNVDGYVGIKGNCLLHQTKFWYSKGNALIFRMLNINKICSIEITSGGNSTSFTVSGATNGKGTDATVLFNHDFDPDIMTVDKSTTLVRNAKRPPYIGLAHELIHADHAMRGVVKTGTADYKYKTSRTKSYFIFSWWWWWSYTYTTQKDVLKEELSTVGLAYSGDITENQIRNEHGLELRGAY